MFGKPGPLAIKLLQQLWLQRLPRDFRGFAISLQQLHSDFVAIWSGTEIYETSPRPWNYCGTIGCGYAEVDSAIYKIGFHRNEHIQPSELPLPKMFERICDIGLINSSHAGVP